MSQNLNCMSGINLFRVWWKCTELETLVIDSQSRFPNLDIHCGDSCRLHWVPFQPIRVLSFLTREIFLSWMLGFCKHIQYDWLNFKHFPVRQIWVKLICRLTKSGDQVLTSIFTIQEFLHLWSFTYKYQKTLHLLIYYQLTGLQVPRWYRVSHETWQLVNSVKCLLPWFLSCLILKRLIKSSIWQSCYSKIDFKVKHISVKDFLTK